MDKYNNSHVRDLTAYQAEINIMQETHKKANKLLKLINADAKLAGFIIPETVIELREVKTGITITTKIGGSF